MIENRVVLLNHGEYAKQRRISVFGISPFGWEFYEFPHPECNFLQTYKTLDELNESEIDRMGIKDIIKEYTR